MKNNEAAQQLRQVCFSRFGPLPQYPQHRPLFNGNKRQLNRRQTTGKLVYGRAQRTRNNAQLKECSCYAREERGGGGERASVDIGIAERSQMSGGFVICVALCDVKGALQFELRRRRPENHRKRRRASKNAVEKPSCEKGA